MTSYIVNNRDLLVLDSLSIKEDKDLKEDLNLSLVEMIELEKLNLMKILIKDPHIDLILLCAKIFKETSADLVISVNILMVMIINSNKEY